MKWREGTIPKIERLRLRKYGPNPRYKIPEDKLRAWMRKYYLTKDTAHIWGYAENGEWW